VYLARCRPFLTTMPFSRRDARQRLYVVTGVKGYLPSKALVNDRSIDAVSWHRQQGGRRDAMRCGARRGGCARCTRPSRSGFLVSWHELQQAVRQVTRKRDRRPTESIRRHYFKRVARTQSPRSAAPRNDRERRAASRSSFHVCGCVACVYCVLDVSSSPMRKRAGQV